MFCANFRHGSAFLLIFGLIFPSQKVHSFFACLGSGWGQTDLGKEKTYQHWMYRPYNSYKQYIFVFLLKRSHIHHIQHAVTKRPTCCPRHLVNDAPALIILSSACRINLSAVWRPKETCSRGTTDPRFKWFHHSQLLKQLKNTINNPLLRGHHKLRNHRLGGDHQANNSNLWPKCWIAVVNTKVDISNDMEDFLS